MTYDQLYPKLRDHRWKRPYFPVNSTFSLDFEVKIGISRRYVPVYHVVTSEGKPRCNRLKNNNTHKKVKLRSITITAQ